MGKKFQSYLYYIIATATVVALKPVSALAISGSQINEINTPIIISNESGIGILSSAAATVINIMLLIAGILAVIYLVYSGIIYVTAGGDTAKADKGRVGIVNAIIGIVIIAAAYLIVRFVGGAISTGQSGTNESVVF